MPDLPTSRNTETATIKAIRCLYEHGFTDHEIAEEARTDVKFVVAWRQSKNLPGRPEGLPVVAGGYL